MPDFDLPDDESAIPLEATDADAMEQHALVGDGQRDILATEHWDADEGDLAESSVEVPLDEDSYR